MTDRVLPTNEKWIFRALNLKPGESEGRNYVLRPPSEPSCYLSDAIRWIENQLLNQQLTQEQHNSLLDLVGKLRLKRDTK